jgi:hypothetical protein
VEDSERAADEVAGEMPRGQHGKRHGSNSEGKEEKPTDPDNQRQQHQESKKRHADIIMGAMGTDNSEPKTALTSARACRRQFPGSPAQPVRISSESKRKGR